MPDLVLPTPGAPPTEPPKTETPATPTTPEPEKKAEGDQPSLLNDGVKPPEAPKAPEKYEAFKAPEGFELDTAAIEKASPLFKELGLSQEGAQKIIDLYADVSQQAVKDVQDEIAEVWKTTREGWVNEIKSDPEIGGKLDVVKTTVSKAIDTVMGSKLGTEFRQAMDLTGAGNHPAFVRGFYKLAQLLVEGGPTVGNGPVRINANGAGRPDPAHALYPNNP